MIEHGKEHVKNCGEALAGEIWRGRQWSVTDYGIEARDGLYVLSWAQLDEDFAGTGHSLPEHVAEKNWVDLDDFLTAWLVARSVRVPRSRDCIRLAYKTRKRANG